MKIIKKIVIFVILAIACVLGVILIENNTNAISKVENNKAELNSNDSESYNNFETWITNNKELKIKEDEKQGTFLFRPKLEDQSYRAYCIEPYVFLRAAGKTSKEDFFAAAGNYEKWVGLPSYVGTTSSPYYKAEQNEQIYTQDDEWKWSPYVSSYQNKRYYYDGHEKLNDVGITTSYPNAITADGQYTYDPNLYDIAYILSFYKYGEKSNTDDWNGMVQNAIWMSPICRMLQFTKANATDFSLGMQLSQESLWYQNFYEQVVQRSKNSQNTNQELQKENGTAASTEDNSSVIKMNPTSNTKAEDLTVQADMEEQKIKVGPYKVDYTDQTVNGKLIKYGGISNMYLVDDVGNQIPITKIYTEKSHVYYANSYGDSDYNTYVNRKKNYRISGQYKNDNFDTKVQDLKKTRNSGTPNYFSVYGNVTIPQLEEIAKQNNTTINDQSVMTGAKDYVDYWDFMRYYPDSGENFYVEYDTSSKIVGSVKLHIDFSWVKCSCEFVTRDAVAYYMGGYRNKDYSYTAYIDYKYQDTDAKVGCRQQAGVIGYGERELITESLELPSKSVSIQQGGVVFEDKKADVKVGENESPLPNGYEDSNDTMLSNIEVTLYEISNGTLTQAKLHTLLSTSISINCNSLFYGIPERVQHGSGLYNLRNDVQKMLKDRYQCTDVQTMKDLYAYDWQAGYDIISYWPDYMRCQYGRYWVHRRHNSGYWVYYRLYSDAQCDAFKAKFEAIKANDLKTKDYRFRTNPTLTDSVGHYDFEGIEMNKKYVVKFTYDGQTYMPTDYLTYKDDNGNIKYQYNNSKSFVDAMDNNPNDTELENAWITTSKGIERSTDRENIISRFADIKSYPNNYVSPEGGYNETFSVKTLTGYTLQSNGEYTQDENKRLIDEYKVINNQSICTNGVISEAINKYIDAKKKYPDQTEMDKIYNGIINGDSTVAKEVQYIKDCKIDSYSMNVSGTYDEYPMFNQFTSNNKDIKAANVYEDSNKVYRSINTKSAVNQGLYKIPQADMAVNKEVYKATAEINGKKEEYTYNKRNGLTKNKDGIEYWDIESRLSDTNYYNTTYTRQVYASDYNYTENSGLNMYITYKIDLRNQAGAIDTAIQELVDYYEPEYTVIGSDNNVASEEVYKPYIGDSGGKKQYDLKTATESIYGTYDNKKSISGYNKVYVTGMDKVPIKASSDMYIYLTLKVNKNNNKLILDDQDIGKENLAEINGYKTYFADNTKLPNNVSKGSTDEAGRVDVDSKPGNITQAATSKGNIDYSKFEDDTDKAPNVKITLTGNRTMSGSIWKDERNTTPEGTSARIGNGIKEDGEEKISGVKVELLEIKNQSEVISYNNAKIWDGTSFDNAKYTTATNEKGEYSFEGFIPGNYIVKYTYGNEQTYSYNGQDYKSTVYDKNKVVGFNVNDPDSNDNPNDLTNNWYDLFKGDSEESHGSDARDIYGNVSTKQTRANVNDYSNNSGNGVTYVRAQELKDAATAYNENLEMTAKTAKINVEIEYDRNESTVAYNKNENYDMGKSYENTKQDKTTNNYTNTGSYIIDNLDFGLTERPKAQLKTTKQVVNVKVTLANGGTLFDATQQATNVLWNKNTRKAHGNNKTNLLGTNDGKDQENTYLKGDNYYDTNLMYEPIARADASKKGRIQLTMDEELMHGATLKITYAIFVANIGEVNYANTENGTNNEIEDYNFYYLGTPSKNAKIATTTANEIIDYVGYQSADKKATRNNQKFIQADNKANER